MRFLVDAQLPPKLSLALVELGHISEHLEDVGLRHAKDNDIWNYAMEHDSVILTKDEDFVARFRRLGAGPVIVWLRIGNSSSPQLLGWLLPLMPAVVRRIRAGDKLIEVR